MPKFDDCPFCGATDWDFAEDRTGSCNRCGATGPLPAVEGRKTPWNWSSRTPGLATRLMLDTFTAAVKVPKKHVGFSQKVVSVEFSEDQAKAFLEEWEQ